MEDSVVSELPTRLQVGVLQAVHVGAGTELPATSPDREACENVGDMTKFEVALKKLSDPAFFKCENGKKIVIVTHHNADVDAVGTAIAFSELIEKTLGQNAPDILCPDGASIAGKRLAKRCGVEFLTNITDRTTKYCGTIIVDSLEPEQLSPLTLDELPKPLLLVMDHHYEKDGLFKQNALAYISTPLPSCAELFYKTFKAVKQWNTLSPTSRLALVAAIITDTQGLRSAIPQTFLTLYELTRDDPETYNDAKTAIAVPQEDSERIAALKALKSIGYERIKKDNLSDGKEILVAWCHAGNFEAYVANVLIRCGADVGIVSCGKKGFVRLSARARKRVEPLLHLGKQVMEPIGEELNGSGGGHAGAASANVYDTEENDALQKCVTLIRQIIESSKSS